MDSVAPDSSRTYRTITPNSVSNDQFVPAGTYVASSSTPFFRRVSTLLGLGAIASAAAFIVGRQNVPATMSWDVREAFSLPTYPDVYSTPAQSFGAPFATQSNAKVMRLAPVTQYAPYGAVMHTDATGDDYSMDERLPSRQCGGGCYCRARLTVVKEGETVTVKAGYFIGSQTKKVRSIPSFIKRNIAKTTTAMATKWAAQLLPSVTDVMSGANCTVTAADVAGAIEIAQNTAVECTKTDDSNCDAMVHVRTCQLATQTAATTGSLSPAPVDTCETFVRSSPAFSSFDDLNEFCPKLRFYYNRVGTPLPFCVTECPDRPGEKHTVYMDYYVSGDGDANRKDCLSKVLPRTYNHLYSTIPSCDAVSVGYGDESEGYYDVRIAKFGEDQDHGGLYSAAKQCGSLLHSAFFTKNFDSLEKVISDSCASA